MSIVNESLVSDMQEKHVEEQSFKGKSMCLKFFEERMFAITSYLDMLSYEGDKRKVYVQAES